MLAVFAVVAGNASAATVQSVPTSQGGMLFDAAPGETNNVELLFEVPDRRWRIKDSGADLQVGNGCVSVNAREATCDFRVGVNDQAATVHLGDGNDRISEPYDAFNNWEDLRDSTIYGDEGADTLSGGMFSHLDGGPGDDTLNIGSHGWGYGGYDNDVLYGGDGDNLLYGGPGDDTLWGDPSLFSLGQGDDSLEGGPGTDQLHGGGTFLHPDKDKASYLGSDVPVTVDLDGVADDGGPFENDVIHGDVEGVMGSMHRDTLTGGPGNDFIDGWLSGDTIDGLGGNDVLDGGGEGDTIYGGGGDDRLTGISSGVFLDGGSGNDVLALSGAGDLHGGSGNDQLTGEGGNQNLRGGPGDDVLVGGTGDDTADYSDRPQGVSVDFAGGGGDGIPGENDVVAYDVENGIGTPFLDTFTGSDRNNRLDGGGGPDNLLGYDGHDVLVEGGGAGDNLNGGGGTDTVDYAAATANVTLTLDGVANDGASGEGDLIHSSVENARGGPAHDTITGNGGANELDGAGGNDTLLDGGGAGDILAGGGGIDYVDYSGRTTPLDLRIDDTANDGAAGEGDDIRGDVEQISGGSASDTIVGGLGDNHLYGQGGDDVVNGYLGNDILFGGPGSDLVTYEGRGEPLTVNLGTGSGGAPGEGDALLEFERVRGGNGNDSLTGDAAGNILEGGPGDDTFDGGPGGDFFADTGGFDTLTYASRVDGVSVTFDHVADDGEPGEGDRVDPDGAWLERIVGGSGDDVLNGSALGNKLEGRGGLDTLDGGSGDDTLLGGTEGDDLRGGPGTDTVDYTGHDTNGRCNPFMGCERVGVIVTLDDTANDGSAVDRGFLPRPGDPPIDNAHSDLEAVIGTVAGDTLTDFTSAAKLHGKAGDDTLVGGNGPNEVVGDEGNDLLVGGGGADVLVGGYWDPSWGGSPDVGGIDTVDYSARTTGVRVSLGSLPDDGEPGEGDYADAEIVLGGSGDDELIGDGGGNKLVGGLGNDTLTGNDGADELIGGAGADTFGAGPGDDLLRSRDNTADTLACGDGSDTAESDLIDLFGSDAGCEVVQLPLPTNTAPPTITGTPERNQTLTANDGTWANTEGATFERQWQRCDGACVDVEGATGATYVLGGADVLKTMRVVVTATSDAGSGTATSAQTGVVAQDSTPPPTPQITSGPTGTVNATSATFELAVAEAGATLACRLDSAEYAVCTSPLTHDSLGEGEHTFSVVAKDEFGNTSAAATRSWIVDTPPDTTITDGPSASTKATSAILTLASTQTLGGFECRLDAGAFATCRSPKRYVGLAPGDHTLEVRAVDATGNLDPTPASRTWSVLPPAPLRSAALARSPEAGYAPERGRIATGIAAGDVDSDGNVDLAIASTDGGFIYSPGYAELWKGNGAGAFTPAFADANPSPQIGALSQAVAVGDLGVDGYAETVSTSHSNNQITITRGGRGRLRRAYDLLDAARNGAEGRRARRRERRRKARRRDRELGQLPRERRRADRHPPRERSERPLGHLLLVRDAASSVVRNARRPERRRPPRHRGFELRLPEAAVDADQQGRRHRRVRGAEVRLAPGVVQPTRHRRGRIGRSRRRRLRRCRPRSGEPQPARDGLLWAGRRGRGLRGEPAVARR